MNSIFWVATGSLTILIDFRRVKSWSKANLSTANAINLISQLIHTFMADSPASRTTKPSSGIPVPKVKRQSVVSGSTNGQSTPSTGSRPASPVILAPPPASRPSQAIRRQSLLNATERKASFGEMKTDDPGTLLSIISLIKAHLKAQIALLQSSLAASHQRILALTSDLNLESSSTPSTPLNGASNLFDGSTADAYQSGDEESSQGMSPHHLI